MWNIINPKKIKECSCIFVKNTKAQCFPYLCLSSRYMTYALSFILGKLSLAKTPLNLGSKLKYLVISVLIKGWSGTKYLYECYYVLFLLFSLFTFLPLKDSKVVKSANKTPRDPYFCGFFYYFVFYFFCNTIN